MADSTVLRDALAAVIMQATHVSLHTGDPAGTGANEVTGGSPAYERVAISSWADAGDGLCVATLAGPFNVPADTDVEWAGLWNGSTYLDKAPALAALLDQDTVEILYLAFQAA
jgi:hypothetical protein